MPPSTRRYAAPWTTVQTQLERRHQSKARDPVGLKRVKEVMAPGALNLLVKEMIYVAVSVTNNCGYCMPATPLPPARPG